MIRRGIAYMALSALGFSVMSMLVKVVSPRIATGEIVLVRAVVTLILSYAMVRRAGLPPWGTDRRRLVRRGVLGFGGLAGYYVALAYLPLADATVMQNTVPLLTALLAWWWLREPVGRGAAVALGLGLIGVILVVRPHADGIALAPIGVAAALGGAACSAMAYVTVRGLARTEHPLVIVFFFPLVAAPLAVPWALAQWTWPSPTDALCLIAIGAATQVGQVFLTMGLSLERAARASSVNYLQVVFAVGWQLAIFGDLPSTTTLIGGGLIVLGTVVSAARSPAAASDQTAARG